MFYLDVLSNRSSNLSPQPRVFENLLLYLGFSCIVISLFLPSLFTSKGDITGIWVLLTGWMGLFIFQFSWFANPVNLLAILFVTKRPRVSLLLSIFALILASETFWFREIPADINLGKIFIKELGAGFYIWYFAQIVFLISFLLRSLHESMAR